MPLVVPSATLPTRKFGNGPEVTVIGYGAMSITSAYTPLESDEDALKILEAAVDLGIRHVDTANICKSLELDA